MRKTLCASVILLALCGSALAGDINCPPIAPGDVPNPPAPSQPSGTQTVEGSTGPGAQDAASDGIIHGDYADSLSEAVLSALNSVLALV